MLDAAVDDVRAGDPRLHGAQAGLDLGHHALLQSRQQPGQRGGVDLGNQRVTIGPPGVETLDVGEHQQFLGAQSLSQRSGAGIGVDVVHHAVHVRREGGDHRNAPCGNEIMDHRGIDVIDIADQADIGLNAVDQHTAAHRRQQFRVLAGEADGVRSVSVDQVHQFPADLPEQHHPDDVEHLGRSDPEATLELTGDPEALEHGVDLRSAAVHHHRVDTGFVQGHDIGGERGLQGTIGHGVAAVFDHDDLAAQQLGVDGLGVHRGGHELYAEFSST